MANPKETPRSHGENEGDASRRRRLEALAAEVKKSRDKREALIGNERLRKERDKLRKELEDLEAESDRRLDLPERFFPRLGAELKEEFLRAFTDQSRVEIRVGRDLLDKIRSAKDKLYEMERKIRKSQKNATAPELEAYIQHAQNERNTMAAILKEMEEPFPKEAEKRKFGFFERLALTTLKNYIGELDQNIQEAQMRLRRIQQTEL